MSPSTAATGDGPDVPGGAVRTKPRATPGRPRDPDLDDRVIDVVLRLYAEHGWSGLSFGGVAREASVGKAALYLRWPSKAEMLVTALTARPAKVKDIDTGSVRDDLVELGREILRYLNSEAGLAALRLFVDARYQPELFATVSKELLAAPTANSREMIQRAVDRGELPEGTSAQVVLDAIVGGVINHMLSNPDKSWAVLSRNLTRFLRELVQLVVAGAGVPDGAMPGDR
jgi:AcrR family transcriptional regulator